MTTRQDDFLAASVMPRSVIRPRPRVGAGFRAAATRRLLVLIELKGGNDGLNTVVPYADDAYYRLRPRIAIRADQVLSSTLAPACIRR